MKAIRRPADIPATMPLAEVAARYERGSDRRRPSTAGALVHLALGEALARTVARERPRMIMAAIQSGATWPEVAAALDVPAWEARKILRDYADEQRRRYSELDEEGLFGAVGMDSGEHNQVRRMIAVKNGERYVRLPHEGWI